MPCTQWYTLYTMAKYIIQQPSLHKYCSSGMLVGTKFTTYVGMAVE